MTEIETTIKNGLPVIARGIVQSDDPTVELPGRFVEDLEIFFRHKRRPYACGRPFPHELSDEDEQRIVDEIVSAYNEPPDYC